MEKGSPGGQEEQPGERGNVSSRASVSLRRKQWECLLEDVTLRTVCRHFIVRVLPLLVFIFTGQPGCKGRLQGFGSRRTETEWMDGEKALLLGLGAATPERLPWLASSVKTGGEGLVWGLDRALMFSVLDGLSELRYSDCMCWWVGSLRVLTLTIGVKYIKTLLLCALNTEWTEPSATVTWWNWRVFIFWNPSSSHTSPKLQWLVCYELCGCPLVQPLCALFCKVKLCFRTTSPKILPSRLPQFTEPWTQLLFFTTAFLSKTYKEATETPLCSLAMVRLQARRQAHKFIRRNNCSAANVCTETRISN